jgi:hypothetical protein
MENEFNRIADRVRSVWRILIVVALAGCIQRATALVNPPPPEGGGTLTCREIVETCDSTCTDPLCLHGCTNQGTSDAQGQHDALLSCGERNGCTDEECMRTNCMPEWEACEGPAAPAAS